MTHTCLQRMLLACTFLPALAATTAGAQENGHLHHVHMNVSDIERTTEFYGRIFGLAPVRYNAAGPALMTERSFLFLNQVDARSIVNHQLTGLTHVSWGNTGGAQAYQWMQEQGVEFYEPLTELLPGSTYMYLYGPDREVIESTDFSRHHRYNHIHVVAQDAKATAQWFYDVVNPGGAITSGDMQNENIALDGVLFTVFPIGARFTPRENDGSLRPTDGSQLDHIAFAFADLDAALARITSLGVTIERPMAVDPEYGFRHFFVRSPNAILVELVEARSWPQAAWEKR